jgi:hypothetical protein
MNPIFMQRYVLAGAFYGFARKSIDVCINAREVTVERRLMRRGNERVYVSRNRPMLVTERIAVVAMHMCACSLYSPFFIVGDLNRAEAHLRGIDIAAPPGENDDEQSLIFHAMS